MEAAGRKATADLFAVEFGEVVRTASSAGLAARGLPERGSVGGADDGLCGSEREVGGASDAGWKVVFRSAGVPGGCDATGEFLAGGMDDAYEYFPAGAGGDDAGG